MLENIKKAFENIPILGGSKLISKVTPTRTPGVNLISTDTAFFGGANQAASNNTPIEDYFAAMRGHVWVYRCVNLIATSIASAPNRVWRRKEVPSPEVKIGKSHKWEPTDQHDVLSEILRHPNDYHCWFDLMELTVTDLELTGTAYWEKVRDKTGNVIALYRIKPSRIKPIPDPKMYVSGYIYLDERGQQKTILSPRDIVVFRYSAPDDDYFGLTPMDSLRPELTSDFNAMAFNKAFFRNDATPSIVLETDNSLPRQVIDRLNLEWNKRHAGLGNAHKTAILQGGLKAKVISLTHKDMQFIEMRKLVRNSVLSAFGVPPILVGVVEGANYSNSLEQKQTFWRETVFPKLRKIQNVINRQLAPDNIEFRWNYDDIEDLIEDRAAKSVMEQRYVQAGIWTINEVRARQGLPPVAWGNDWRIPATLMPAGDTQEAVPSSQNEGSLPSSTSASLEPTSVDTDSSNIDLPFLDSNGIPREPEAPRQRLPGDNTRVRDTRVSGPLGRI